VSTGGGLSVVACRQVAAVDLRRPLTCGGPWAPAALDPRWPSVSGGPRPCVGPRPVSACRLCGVSPQVGRLAGVLADLLVCRLAVGASLGPCRLDRVG